MVKRCRNCSFGVSMIVSTLLLLTGCAQATSQLGTSVDKIQQQLSKDTQLNLAFLKIKTIPAQATIFIDQAFRGYAPQLVWLNPGKHLVRIVKDGYVELEFFSEFEAAQKREGSYELTRAVGAVYNAEPPCPVVPMAEDLLPGEITYKNETWSLFDVRRPGAPPGDVTSWIRGVYVNDKYGFEVIVELFGSPQAASRHFKEIDRREKAWTVWNRLLFNTHPYNEDILLYQTDDASEARSRIGRVIVTISAESSEFEEGFAWLKVAEHLAPAVLAEAACLGALEKPPTTSSSTLPSLRDFLDYVELLLKVVKIFL